jgi:hypothetical protein
MTVRLTDLDVAKEGELKGRVLVGRTSLGNYRLNVHLDEVKASLRAGAPRLQFDGGRVGVALPLSVVQGEGRGSIRFRWDGRGIAGGVCGDADAGGAIAGRVIPADHTLQGRIALATEGGTLRATPELEDAAIRIEVEPSEESWTLLDRAVEAKGAVCRAALGAADVREKVRALVDKGFVVRLPPRLVREVRLPVNVAPLLRSGTGEARFDVRPAGVRLTGSRLWYGTFVALRLDGGAS